MTEHSVSHRLAAWALIVCPFAFYIATCSRTIGLGDSAMLMEAIRELNLGTHANSHNLTVILGRLIAVLPLGSASFQANLASALAGATTIALFSWVLYRTTGSLLAAAVTTGVTTVSHSMWWHSTIVESYALNALFTVATLGLLASLHNKHTERKLLARCFSCLPWRFSITSRWGFSRWGHLPIS